MLTLRLKIELAIALVLLGALGVGAKVWLDEHDNRIKAEASVAAQQQLQQQYQAQVSDLAKQMAEREGQYKSELQALDSRFSTAQTPQAVAQLASVLMGLSKPIQVVTPPPTAQDPHPQPIAQISSLDFPRATEYLHDCETYKLNLAKATADAADREAQAHLAQLQIDSLKKENTSLQTAIKGGTFFQRLGKATKYLIIGGAAALVATCTTGHCK